MEKLLVKLFILLSFSAFSMDTIIISDLDDTIKRTNVRRTLSAGVNALFTRKVFTGMPSLLEELETQTSGLYILSNSVNLFRPNIYRLMRKFDLNPLDISTRSLFRDRNKFKYKYDYIVEKITSLNAKVILVGDDIGEDPEVYAKVLAEYPDQVVAIYIHRINKREIPSIVTPYHSFLDIALYEYEAGRFNLSQVEAMAKKFMSIKKMKRVFPRFKYCPTNYWRNLGENEISPIIENMTNKVIKFCKRR